MSLKEITKLEDFLYEINKLNGRVEKLEDDGYVQKIKDRLIEQLNNLQNKEDIEVIRKNLMRIETDITTSEIMSSIPHNDLNNEEKEKLKVEVSKIIDSLSDQKEETIRKPRASKPKRYIALDSMKAKINKIITYIKESDKFRFKNKISDIKNKISDVVDHIKEQKGLTPRDKMNGIIDLRNRTKAKRVKINLKSKIMEVIGALTYKPQHAKQNKYLAKGKKMAEKIGALSSNVAKSIVTKVSLLRKKITMNIEKAKMQRQSKIELKEKEKAKIQEQSPIESIEDRTTLYRPEIQKQSPIESRKKEKITLRKPKADKSTIYTAEKGTKNKMKKNVMLRLAAAVMAFGMVGSMTGMALRNAGKTNSVYEESIKVTPDYLAEMENNLKLREENPEVKNLKVENKNNSPKPSQDKNNSNAKPNQNSTNSKPEEKPSQNNTNSNIDKNNNNTNQTQSNSYTSDKNNNTKPEEKPENNKENEIKKIYGGEISASENGIRTEEDILYAVKKIGWSKDRVENIKEMMPGLLAMQRDFDIDPLCALAIFQWESGCGTAYEPGGSAYERDNDFRLANTLQYQGQNGVMGLSNLNYTYYDSWSTAAYEFGNYVRNAKHYAESEKGAQTMKDLEKFNGLRIFTNAGTMDAATYNKLKGYLEKKITIDDVSKVVDKCVASEITEMTDTIKSNIDKEQSANKEMAGR